MANLLFNATRHHQSLYLSEWEQNGFELFNGGKSMQPFIAYNSSIEDIKKLAIDTIVECIYSNCDTMLISGLSSYCYHLINECNHLEHPIHCIEAIFSHRENNSLIFYGYRRIND